MTDTPLESIYTPALGREVLLRTDTSDRQVWADTFTGLYHVPPPDMPTPRLVLDLGANIGLTTAHYKALWPDATVAAVEMDEGCCMMLAANEPDVYLGGFAVTGGTGRWGTYNPGLRAEAYTLRPIDDIDDRPEGWPLVMCCTMREVIRQAFGHELRSLPTVDFCKMDIEGAEWGIFETADAWSLHVRHLLVELHPALPHHTEDSPSLVKEAIDMLNAQGFNARHHERHPRAVYAWR